MMKEELAKPESRPHDVRARAAMLGFDPMRMFEFVQKEIRFEPYPGIQRGPAGVLVSGAGNSADKAFLLMELLRAGGHPARMVWGRASREQEEELVRNAISGWRNRRSNPLGPFGNPRPSDSGMREVCGRIGWNADSLLSLDHDAQELQRRAWKRVSDIVVREQTFVEERVSAAKISESPRALAGEMAQAVRTHYWVQWRKMGQESWVDLDPCFRDAAPGTAKTQIQEIVKDPRSLADSFCVTLSLERNGNGKRETVVLLRQEIPIFETLTNPLRLIILPTRFEVDPNPTEQTLYSQFSSSQEFQAALSVRDETRASKIFDYQGRVSEVKSNGSLALLSGKSVGRLRDRLRGMGEGSGASEGKDALLNLWVDFEVTRGKERVWAQTRTILAEEQRANWCPGLEWDLFFQTHEISPEFLRAKRLTCRVRNEPLLERWKNWAVARDKKSLDEAREAREYHYPLDLAAFCLARQAFLEQRVASDGTKRLLYFDIPNLFLRTRGYRRDASAKTVGLSEGIDIVENGAVVLQCGAEATLDRPATTALGVFDTVLEEVLVGMDRGGEAVVGTASCFERARTAAQAVHCVRPGDSRELAKTGLSKSDVDWIRKNTHPQRYVILCDGLNTTVSPHAAWWSWDPGRGAIIGRISGGRGGAEACRWIRQEAVEKVTITSLLSIKNIGWVLRYLNTCKEIYKAMKEGSASGLGVGGLRAVLYSLDAMGVKGVGDLGDALGDAHDLAN